MDKDTLTKAVDDIKKYPKSFLDGYYMLGAFQTIDSEIKKRTDATDTLSVSIPTEMLEDFSKLEWLPYIKDKNVSIEGDKLIFDWFSLPEDKTGFGIAASEFVEKLISALDSIDDPYNFNEDTIAAMVEAERISRDPNVPSYNSVEDLMAALETDD